MNWKFDLSELVFSPLKNKTEHGHFVFKCCDYRKNIYINKTRKIKL